MTGTIWSVGGSESIGNRVNWPGLNCRRQITVWQGLLDADNNMTLDYHPSGGQWPNIVASINAKYGITEDYPDMIGPDLEYGGWSVVKLAGPSHDEWDHMASEMARNVADFRSAYPNATHIKAYNLPAANKWSRSAAAIEVFMERQRALLARCPDLTAGLVVLYRSKSMPTWNVPYFQGALNDAICLCAEFGLTPVAHIGYRYTPNGDAPERFSLIPEDEIRTQLREVIRDAEWQGHKCVDIGVWDQAKWEWGVCQRTNPDGTFSVTTVRQNHIRSVLTSELDAAGVDGTNLIAVQAYWDAIANERYVWINEEMGWEMVEPPVVVPMDLDEAIERSAQDLKVIVDAAHASSADAVAAAAAHVTLVGTLTGGTTP